LAWVADYIPRRYAGERSPISGGGVAYDNIVGRNKEVTLRRARLVPGWATVFGG